MDRRQRVMLLGIAAAIAVAAVVIALVAGGGDDDGDNSTSSTTAAQSETTPAGADSTQQTTTVTTPPAPQGASETIDIKAGEPDGGVKDIKVKKDDQLEITVNSDQELPIHFHGYDIEKDAAPGKPAVFKLKAENEGVFEIEIESTGTKISEVTVGP
jgi:hypothetical protein